MDGFSRKDLVMTDNEVKKWKEISKALDVEEQLEIIKHFDTRVIFNELESRVQRSMTFEQDLKGVMNGYWEEMQGD